MMKHINNNSASPQKCELVYVYTWGFSKKLMYILLVLKVDVLKALDVIRALDGLAVLVDKAVRMIPHQLVPIKEAGGRVLAEPQLVHRNVSLA